jgi:hypothetical protein
VKIKHFLLAAAACAVAIGSEIGSAANFPRDSRAFVAGFIRVGHDNIVVDPTVRRYTGMVAALGAPDADGKLYSFKPSPVGPRSFPLKPDDLRGWRLTVLAGKRFGQVFTVATNSESDITITADKGSIDGLGISDVFVIESVDAAGVSLYGATPGSTPALPGI